ncbi:MAG: TOMM precursor leader peptide-binding protein [Oscillospiraceae bacterium]|nr:TOMM precursor leader peptide-binding protein [Oscillospiraceae bacterium]
MSVKKFIINPKFSYFFDADTVFLHAERAGQIISNPIIYKILKEIHGGVGDTDSLIERLCDDVSAAHLYFYVGELTKHRIICEPCEGLPLSEVAFWEEIAIPAASVEKLLSNATIEIKTVNYNFPIDEFREACVAAGLKIGTSGDVRVVITEDYESAELEEINKDALLSGKPWMLVKPSGAIAMVGPLFLKGYTGCWQCLVKRLSMNRQARFNVSSDVNEIMVTTPGASHSLLRRMAFDLSVLEVIKFLQNPANCTVKGQLISLNAANFESGYHVLTRRPQCKACGEKVSACSAKLSLDEACLPLTLDGGFRTVDPEDTYARYQHHVSPITGVAQFVKYDREEANAPVYNYLSGANIAMQNPENHRLNNHVRSYTGGKGKNHAQAKAGALCEALERYSCTSTGDDELLRGSYNALGDLAIDPRSCMLYSEAQYKNRDSLNSQCLKHYFLIPAVFNDDEEMEWVRFESLNGGEPRHLPASYCLFNFSRTGFAERSCYADSNGCAAGNTLEEAVLQGLMELVERDSVAIWWYNMLSRPQVDLKSFRNPYIERLITYHKSLGRTLYALDLTFDLGIPCFVGVSHENGKRIMIGFGAHTDPNVAMERAMVEVNQFFPTLRMGGPDADKAILDWVNNATLENQPYLVPAPSVQKTYEDYLAVADNNIVKSINFCLDKLRQKNLSVYYKDMTKPDIGMPVVRVVVPGLRHFWKRFAPGRLYTVPVELGLLDREKSEDELNQLSVFF